MIQEQLQVQNQLKRITDIFCASNGAVRPHFMITGPSGSGKSHIIQALAMEAGLHNGKLDATEVKHTTFQKTLSFAANCG